MSARSSRAEDHERSLSEATFVVSNRSEAPAPPDPDPRRGARRPSSEEYAEASMSLVRQMEILSRLHSGHSGSPGGGGSAGTPGRPRPRRRDRPDDAAVPRRRGGGRDGSDASGGSDLLERYFRSKDRNRTPSPDLGPAPPAPRQMDGAAFHAERRSLLERASVGERVGTITVDRRGQPPAAASPPDGGGEGSGPSHRMSELTADFPDDLECADGDGDRVDRRVSDLTATEFDDCDDDGLEAELLESLGRHGVGGKDEESNILGGSLIRNMSKVTLHEHDEEDRDSESEMRRKDR